MDRLYSALFVVGLVLMAQLFTGCAGSVTRTVSYGRAPYQGQQFAQGQHYVMQQNQGYSDQGIGRCYNGVYSCPPVAYHPGYQAPAPQYGPYGYSAAMTARVTPHVVVQPSAPKRAIRVQRRIR